MNKGEFALLTTAGAVASVTIYRGKDTEGKWEVFAYGEDQRSIAPVDAIEAARGNRRNWASLDRALAWVRENGFTGKVEIDG